MLVCFFGWTHKTLKSATRAHVWERTAKNTLSWSRTSASRLMCSFGETSADPIWGWVILSRSYVEGFYLLNRLFRVWVGQLGRYSDWATGWTVRGSKPGGARFSARPDLPWGPPSLLYNGYRVFPGGKVRPGHAADHSSTSSAVVV